jgi:hypothetical protein
MFSVVATTFKLEFQLRRLVQVGISVTQVGISVAFERSPPANFSPIENTYCVNTRQTAFFATTSIHLSKTKTTEKKKRGKKKKRY